MLVRGSSRPGRRRRRRRAPSSGKESKSRGEEERPKVERQKEAGDLFPHPQLGSEADGSPRLFAFCKTPTPPKSPRDSSEDVCPFGVRAAAVRRLWAQAFPAGEEDEDDMLRGRPAALVVVCVLGMACLLGDMGARAARARTLDLVRVLENVIANAASVRLAPRLGRSAGRRRHRASPARPLPFIFNFSRKSS